jgi:uncharacterized protein YybS (DUF2232 family)
MNEDPKISVLPPLSPTPTAPDVLAWLKPHLKTRNVAGIAASISVVILVSTYVESVNFLADAKGVKFGIAFKQNPNVSKQ